MTAPMTVSIELANERASGAGSACVTVTAHVGTGSSMLVIPQSLRDELGLETIHSHEIGITDGTVAHYDVVGPLTVRYGDRAITSRALTLPGAISVVLGSEPFEALGLSLDPTTNRVVGRRWSDGP